jgi:hypothetical protein
MCCLYILLEHLLAYLLASGVGCRWRYGPGSVYCTNARAGQHDTLAHDDGTSELILGYFFCRFAGPTAVVALHCTHHEESQQSPPFLYFRVKIMLKCSFHRVHRRRDAHLFFVSCRPALVAKKTRFRLTVAAAPIQLITHTHGSGYRADDGNFKVTFSARCVVRPKTNIARMEQPMLLCRLLVNAGYQGQYLCLVQRIHPWP